MNKFTLPQDKIKNFCEKHYIPLPLQSWNFERVKASGLNDRKWVHITNMDPFSIV